MIKPRIPPFPIALALTLLTIMLTACSEPPAGTAANTLPVHQRLPAEPALAEIYGRTCANCHAVAGSLAPLTGEPVWRARSEKGMDVLLANTINGYNGMPPLGMCFECDETQFRALIEFMATPATAVSP